MIHPKRRHLQALITSKTEHPFDVENYLPLKEAFAAVPCDNAVMAFLLNRAVGENSKLAERLGKLGFRSFKPLAAGNHSYVLQVPGEVYLAGDHLHMGMQVIRFSNGQEKPRALALEQIQPVPTQSKVPIDPDSPTNKMYYDLLPMIPHEATAEQLEAFHADAHEKYGMPEHHVNEVDIKAKNAKSLKQGQVLGVDQDFFELPHTSKTITKERRQNASYTQRQYDPERDWRYVVTGRKDASGKPMHSKLFKFLPTGTISLQEDLFRSLMDGRIRGVLSDDDRDRLRRGEFEQLRQEKPECFIYPLRGELTDAEKDAFNRGGIQALYDIRPKTDFMEVTRKELPEFMKMVFDDKLYPSQAMLEMYLNKSLTHDLATAVAAEDGGHAIKQPTVIIDTLPGPEAIGGNVEKAKFGPNFGLVHL